MFRLLVGGMARWLVGLDKVASTEGRCDARATRLRHVIRVYLPWTRKYFPAFWSQFPYEKTTEAFEKTTKGRDQ